MRIIWCLDTVSTGQQLISSPPNKIDEVQKKIRKKASENTLPALLCSHHRKHTVSLLLLSGVHLNFVLMVTSGQLHFCVSNKILVLMECRRYTVEILRSCFESDYNLFEI